MLLVYIGFERSPTTCSNGWCFATDTQKDVFDRRSFDFGGVCSSVVVTMRGGASSATDVDVGEGVSFKRLSGAAE
ncbi:hypothetical protein Tco_0996749 [Tanacetum coccineum]